MEDTHGRTPVEIALERCGKREAVGDEPPTKWTRDALLSTFVELAKLREAADAWQKKCKASLDVFEEIVADYFEEEEIDGDKRRGRNIVRRRELWPKIEKDDLQEGVPDDASDELLAAIAEQARSRLIEALSQDPQTEHLVKSTFNHNTLRSWVRNDLPVDPETLMPVVPEHLKGKLAVVEKWRVSVLKT